MISDRDGRNLQSLQRQAAHAHNHCQFLASRLRLLTGWIGAGDPRLHHIRRFFDDIEEYYQRVAREAERPPPDDRRSRRSQRLELKEIVGEMLRKTDELDAMVLGLEVEHELQNRRSGQRPPEAGH